MSIATPEKPTSPNSSPRRLVLFGCSGLILIATIAVGIFWLRFSSVTNQPVNKTQVLVSLAGVPIYPDAQFDDVATRASRAALIEVKGLDAFKNSTAAGFRTDADPEKQVIPYYDHIMDEYGFQKTQIKSGLGTLAEASYVNTSEGTEVVVIMQPDKGEASMLLLLRCDGGTRKELHPAANVVMPEDFQKPGPLPPASSTK